MINTTNHKPSSTKIKPREHELDLRLERRPLSPVNKLDPKDPKVKAKVTANKPESSPSKPRLSKTERSREKWKKKVDNISKNPSLSSITELEECFEIISEVGDFPMLGESTQTTPSPRSEASRESNEDPGRDGSESIEVREHHSCNEDRDMEVETSDTTLTATNSTTEYSHIQTENLPDPNIPTSVSESSETSTTIELCIREEPPGSSLEESAIIEPEIIGCVTAVYSCTERNHPEFNPVPIHEVQIVNPMFEEVFHDADTPVQHGEVEQTQNKAASHTTTTESPDPSIGELTDIKNETLETLYGDDEDESLDDILIYDVINLYQSQLPQDNGLWSIQSSNVTTGRASNEDGLVEQTMMISARADSAMAQPNDDTTVEHKNQCPPTQLSQSLLLAHEEEVIASDIIPKEPSVSNPNQNTDTDTPRFEDWKDQSHRMSYQTKEKSWGGDGTSEADVAIITQGRASSIPTNADLIKNIYGYDEIDDPRIPDELYYRWCKKPTTAEEVYRRKSFRRRRRAYFLRSAIKIGPYWFPEIYLPDPEDPEWSWKEGIEMDKPAQSLYQLNHGRVFWDPYKHLRVNGTSPHYKYLWHAICVNPDVPPNPVSHVQRTTSQFSRFDAQKFPRSEFTVEEDPDSVMYHPEYRGIKIQEGTNTDPIDLTFDPSIFRPPPQEEWIKLYEDPQEPIPVDDAPELNNLFDPSSMIDYLSPRESQLEDDCVIVIDNNCSKWGEYPPRDKNNLNAWKRGGSVLIQEQAKEVQPTTSRGVEHSKETPKRVARKSFQSSRLNELAANISPPAAPKLKPNKIYNKPRYQSRSNYGSKPGRRYKKR